MCFSLCRFEVNFGQLATPWCRPPPGFIFIDKIALHQRVRGMLPPAKKTDCEVSIMSPERHTSPAPPPSPSPGQLTTPWCRPPPGLIFIDKIAVHQRVRGMLPPAKKTDCEVSIMSPEPSTPPTLRVS